MERPRIALVTLSTSSTTYVDLLNIEISKDALGVSYFVLSIDPDPKALYKIILARILETNDLEITAIWSVELPHITSGVYKGLKAGDKILIQHKTTDAAVTVKTGLALAFNEVVTE